MGVLFTWKPKDQCLKKLVFSEELWREEEGGFDQVLWSVNEVVLMWM